MIRLPEASPFGQPDGRLYTRRRMNFEDGGMEVPASLGSSTAITFCGVSVGAALAAALAKVHTKPAQ